jgi:biotin-(acetyl-CoA carboxylase) ligase
MSDVRIPLTLIPLRMGCIVREQLQKFVDPDVRIKLKWPNDILINGGKVRFIPAEVLFN